MSKPANLDLSMAFRGLSFSTEVSNSGWTTAILERTKIMIIHSYRVIFFMFKIEILYFFIQNKNPL